MRIGIVGTGVMGADIAASLALSCDGVAVWGRSEDGVKKARERTTAALEMLVAEGLAVRGAAAEALERFVWTTDMKEAVSTAQFVVEAVTEDLELKQSILLQVERDAPIEAVLASTTSALSPTEIARPLARPEQFVVAHYAQPAHLMMLVEVVPGKATRHETVTAIEGLLERSGKMPARCADVPGFVFSRLQQALLREFVFMIDRGDVTAETCDTVLKYGFAHRLPVMGTFEHADLAGLELMSTMADRVWPDLATTTSSSGTALGRLRDEGNVGMIAGRGFYDWTTRDAAGFRTDRDREIIRRLKLLRGGEVVLDQRRSG